MAMSETETEKAYETFLEIFKMRMVILNTLIRLIR